MGSARERWNRRYRGRGNEPFPSAPSAWLTENRELLPRPGDGAQRALDVACGSGRDAAWLARLGFDVDAVDISDVAIDALRAAAAARSMSLTAHRLDLERDPLPRSEYELIVVMNYLQRSLFAALAAALAPSGLLVVETVTDAHVEELGREFDARFLLRCGELRAAFPELEVLRYEEGVVQRSGLPRAVASLVARKPP